MARGRREFNAVEEGILTAPSTDPRPTMQANHLPDSMPPKDTIRPAPNFRAFAPAGTVEANLVNAGAMALAAPGAVAVPEVGAVLAAAPAYGLVSDMAEEYKTARRSGASWTDALAQVTEGLTSRENVPAAVLGAIGAARLAAMPQGTFDGGRFLYPSARRTSPPLLPAGGADGAGAVAGQAAVAGPYANRLLSVPAPRPAVALTGGTVSASPQKTPYFDFELLKSASVLKPSAKTSVGPKGGTKGGTKGGPAASPLRQTGESDQDFVRRLDLTGPTAKLAQETQRLIDMGDYDELAELEQDINQMKAAGRRTRVRYTKLSDVKNPSKTALTEQDFHAILDRGSGASAKLKAAVLSRPDLPEDILMEVASNGTAPMQAAIAGRSDLPEAAARWLMQSGKTEVLDTLARRKDLTEAAVAQLYLSPRTRYAAATSPSAPPYIAELAAWDPDPYVNYTAASNPELSASAASALLTRSSNLFVLDKLASRTDVSPESLVNALGQFAADGPLFEDRWAARNNAQPFMKTSPKRGDKPVAPPLGERVLGHLLLNPTLPQASLEGMLSSLDRALNPSLRGAILRRRGTTDKLDMYRRLVSPSDDMSSMVRDLPPLLDKRGRDRFGIKKAMQTALSNPNVRQRLEDSVRTVGMEITQKMDNLEPEIDALLADLTPANKTSAVAGDSKIYTSVNSYRTLEDAWGGAAPAAANVLYDRLSQIRIPRSVTTLLDTQSGDATLKVLGDVGSRLQRSWIFDPLLTLSPKESVLPDVFDKTISPLLSRMSSLNQRFNKVQKQASDIPFEPVLTSPFAEALASRVFSPETATSMVLESLTRPPTPGWRYDSRQYEHPVFQIAAKHPGLNNPAVLNAVTDGVVAESRKLLPSILDKIAMSHAHPKLVNDYVRALSEVADLDPRVYAMRDIDVYSPGDLRRFITPQQLTERSWSAQNTMGNYVYDGFKTSSQSIRLLGSAKTILESPGTTVGRGFVMDGYTYANGRPHDPTQSWSFAPNTTRAQIADYGDPSVRFPRLKLGQAINSYLRLRGLDEALGSGSQPLYDLVPTMTTPIEREPYHAHNELRRYFDDLGVAHTEVVAGHNAPDVRPSAFIIPERMMTHELSSVIREMYPHADIITSRSTDDRAAKTREYMRAGHREDAKGGNTRSASKGGDASGVPGASVPPSTPAQSGGPRIVINPQVFSDKRDALCVAFNEAIRLVCEENGFEPVSEPTEAQRKFFSDTAYADDELQLRRTILARIATLDTSVKDPTDEQLEETAEMLEMVMEVGAPQNEWEQSAVQRLHDMVVRMRESPRSPAPAERPEETGSAQAAEGAGVTMTGSELDFLRRRYESGASMDARQRAIVEAANAQGVRRGESGFVNFSLNPSDENAQPAQPAQQTQEPAVKVTATGGGPVDWNGRPTSGAGMYVPNEDELAFLRRRRDSGASLSMQQRRILELTDGNDLA